MIVERERACIGSKEVWFGELVVVRMVNLEGRVGSKAGGGFPAASLVFVVFDGVAVVSEA